MILLTDKHLLHFGVTFRMNLFRKTAALVLTVCMITTCMPFDVAAKVRMGWKLKKDTWYYVRSNGSYAKGWKKISGKWYFFDKKGAMQTGYITVSGRNYYLKKTGARFTGWKQKKDGRWIYFGAGGSQYFKKWVSYKNHRYRIGSDGYMVTGDAVIGGKHYHFYKSGAMARNRVIGKYRYGKNGVGLPVGVYTYVTRAQMKRAGYKSSAKFREAVIKACEAMEGAGYASAGRGNWGWMGNGQYVDCITYAQLAYAQALGYIKNLHTVDGSVYGLKVTYKGKRYKKRSTGAPFYLYTVSGATGCTAWLSGSHAQGCLGIGRPRAVGAKITPSAIGKDGLNIKRGDIVFFGSTKDNRWHHATVYSGEGIDFYHSHSSDSRADVVPCDYKGLVENGRDVGFDRMLVLRAEDFG